ncbi:carboxymuconolactone decarboxylase family protein [Gracilibacillus alcaliphilus]|uniref:carboxymuconolactone decarboxylase family protein n=1 Tax=Gracilibacillus alcaliphilus TaxID=1401441 RepID=UPI00195AAFC3|nr:carboxymuconolactone decarboxylase family protein [Gracilibacillus alcaliphilus]
MDNRINYFKVAPDALETIMESEKYVRKTSIDKKLKELIKIRVSQINGCSYCLNMHTKAAEKLKVSTEKMNRLDNWKETEIFTEEEKAAFELAEHMTLISENGVSNRLYEQVRQYYNEKEYVELVMVIIQINTWNRLSIAMGNHAEVQ